VKSLACKRFLTTVILTNKAQAFRDVQAVQDRRDLSAWVLASTDLLTAQDILLCCIPFQIGCLAWHCRSSGALVIAQEGGWKQYILGEADHPQD
jgi:hypothetical protein